jgi:hypothetical protein
VKLSSLSNEQASALSVRALGLDSELIDLTSQECLAASLRRAASFMCPTNPSRLLDAVLSAVRPVSPKGGISRDQLAGLLDLLVATGDLLELRLEVERSVRLLYLGPPSFIEREAGSYLLLGIRPFGAPLVDAELGEEIELEGHTRTIRLDAKTARDRLVGAGLQPIERVRWVASPRVEDPRSLVDRVGEQLDAAGPSGDIEDLTVLDPNTSVRYYKGRWRSPKTYDTGDFVARRPQAYGADLWCCVRLMDGMPKKMVEFPIDNPVVPGRDEAWRMQMAIDALRGIRQRYGTTTVAGADATVVSFFSPIPGFAERYLQLVGLAIADSPGSLFSFRAPKGAMPALEVLLTEMLWMEPVVKDGSL